MVGFIVISQALNPQERRCAAHATQHALSSIERREAPAFVKGAAAVKTLGLLTALLTLSLGIQPAGAESGKSTRVTDPNQHVRRGSQSYPYRGKVDYILKELDLQRGDVVVDIGAGSGWWTERIAEKVGPKGIVHATEVKKTKVKKLKEKFDDVPQVRPLVTPTDTTELPENTCDLAFFSQVYHHLPSDGEVDYLKHLRSVVKPMGRLIVIEKYPLIATKLKEHATQLSKLVGEAEKAGWVPVRSELMTGSYHYIAIFVQKDLFPPEDESESGVAKVNGQPKPKFEDVAVTQAERLRQSRADLVVLDIRTPEEYRKGHIPGAINMDYFSDDFEKNLRALEKDSAYLMHCASGGRSSRAKELMKKLGFKSVFHLQNGFNAWKEADMPTENGAE